MLYFTNQNACFSAPASENFVQAHKALFEKSLNQIAKPSEVVAASLTERQKEIQMLRSRWDKQKQVATSSNEVELGEEIVDEVKCFI